MDSINPSALRKSIGSRSSLACLECRSRHVKCDGKRPQCSRCDELRRECHYNKSRRGGLDRAARIERLRRLASAQDLLPSYLVQLNAGLSLNETAGAAQCSISGRSSEPSLKIPLDHIRNFEDDALVKLYYRKFHKFHPLTLPRAHLIKLCQDPGNQPRLAPLVAVLRLIGHLHGFQEWSSPINDLIKVCLLQAPQEDPFMVQCRMLYSMTLFWYSYEAEARREMHVASRLALGLGMFRREFAAEHGGNDLVMRECWRRTWWMLFIVDGYYAGTLDTLESAFMDVEPTVELPCEESDYELGEIPEPKTLEDFDCREFAISGASFSSFAYLIGAVRCVAAVISLALNMTNKDSLQQVIHEANSIIDGWLLLLPSDCKQIMDKSGEIDELMFQANLIIHVATISLNRPLSDLKFNPVESISTCARQPPPSNSTPEMVNVHTVRVMRSIEAQIRLLALPARPFQHTPFTTCMVSEGTLALLSACKFLLNKQEVTRARDKIRLTIGCLRSLGDIWPRTAKNLREIQMIARHVLGLKEVSGIPSINDLPSLSSSEEPTTQESDIGTSSDPCMMNSLDDLCSWHLLGDLDTELPGWGDQWSFDN